MTTVEEVRKQVRNMMGDIFMIDVPDDHGMKDVLDYIEDRLNEFYEAGFADGRLECDNPRRE